MLDTFEEALALVFGWHYVAEIHGPQGAGVCEDFLPLQTGIDATDFCARARSLSPFDVGNGCPSESWLQRDVQ